MIPNQIGDMVNVEISIETSGTMMLRTKLNSFDAKAEQM